MCIITASIHHAQHINVQCGRKWKLHHEQWFSRKWRGRKETHPSLMESKSWQQSLVQRETHGVNCHLHRDAEHRQYSLSEGQPNGVNEREAFDKPVSSEQVTKKGDAFLLCNLFSMWRIVNLVFISFEQSYIIRRFSLAIFHLSSCHIHSLQPPLLSIFCAFTAKVTPKRCLRDFLHQDFFWKVGLLNFFSFL